MESFYLNLFINATSISKKIQEANELLLELHELNCDIIKNSTDRTKKYILWLMNWFSDGTIRKQKATSHRRREKSDFPKG